MKASGWTCQRVTLGVPCKHRNRPRTRKCQACGKPRPPKRTPGHMVALALEYEDFVILNGGERCGICGREPSEKRLLDRDHCHATGTARGLLCARCNRALPSWMTADWLRSAIRYLERAAA